jgi:hypothetical protein
MTAAALKESAPSRKSMDVSLVKDFEDKLLFRFQMVAEDGTRGAPWSECAPIVRDSKGELMRIEVEHEIDGEIVQELHVCVLMKRKDKESGKVLTEEKWMIV